VVEYSSDLGHNIFFNISTLIQECRCQSWLIGVMMKIKHLECIMETPFYGLDRMNIVSKEERITLSCGDVPVPVPS
jgi:hypothetical protein